MLPDSENTTDNPCDFSSWFNNSEDADVLLHLSTSAEANGQQQQQLNVLASVDGEQQLQQQQISVSAAADGEQQEQLEQQLSVLAFVDGEQQEQQQQQQQQLSVLAEANKQLQQQQQQHARSFHAHAVILRQRSAYFRSSLTNAWQQASEPRSIGDRKAATSAPTAAVEVRFELVEHVETDKLDAMEELLRLMYSQKVPVGTPIELLLQMLRLADCYQAVACMQLLLTHLATAGKHAIPLNLAAQVFSMPASVQTCLAFKSLCSEVAVKHYSDVSAVIQSDDLRQQFCKLPHVAVLAWAESDRLQVQSENCVVYLLSAWVKAQQQQGGQGVSAAQLDQLAHQVRVLQLGLAYQFFVLPNLKWFKGCSSMPHWNTLMAYKGMTSTGKPVFPSQAVGQDCNPEWQWDGPAAWVAGPRQLLPAAPRSFKWDLGPEELQQLYEGRLDIPVRGAQQVLYVNGFQLFLHAERGVAKAPGQGATVGAYLHVYHQLMSQHGVPWPGTASVSVRKLEFKVHAASGVTAARCCGFNTRSAAGHKGWGFADILSRSAPTLEELVAPLLVDGKLLLEMTVEGVDMPAYNSM